MEDDKLEEVKEIVEEIIDTTESPPPPEPEAKKPNIVVRVFKGSFRVFGKLILFSIAAFFIFLPIWVVLPVETKAEISAKVAVKTGYVIPTYNSTSEEEAEKAAKEAEEANEDAAYYAELDSYVEPVIDQIITSDMSDYDKAKAVYDWICANIAYDYAGLETGTGNGDPLEVMQTGLADCGGYSGLFDYFMMKLGISCEVVNGSAPEGGYHAWNKVNINGQWLNVDATWGDSPNSEDYFGKTDTEFVALGYTVESTSNPF